MLGEVFVTKSYVKGKKMATKKIKMGIEGPKRSMARKSGVTRATKSIKSTKTQTSTMKRAQASKMGSEGPRQSVSSQTRFRLQRRDTPVPAAQKRAKELELAQRKAKIAGKRLASAEGPKRSVAKKAKSKLAPMTKDSVTKANLIKKSADILTRIPMIQDTNSPANRNLRKSAYQNLQRAKAQSAAKKIGSARSQMVVTRSRKRSR